MAEKSKLDNYFPEIVRPKAAAVGPQIGSTFGKAYKRGKIAFGTDVGVQGHGTNWKEFVYMNMACQKWLQLNQQLWKQQTSKNRKDLGSLEVGKIADIIAVKGNPLKDISVMEM